nr:3569_t:CDS:1 [Entrophospora candida]
MNIVNAIPLNNNIQNVFQQQITVNNIQYEHVKYDECLYANLTKPIMTKAIKNFLDYEDMDYSLLKNTNPTTTIQGYIIIYHDQKTEETKIKGYFYNLPNDLNIKNYHFYLLNKDNSLEYDLTRNFVNGLKITKKITNSNDNKGEIVTYEGELDLLFNKKTNHFRINNYINYWIKIYHLQDNVISNTIPGKLRNCESLV